MALIYVETYILYYTHTNSFCSENLYPTESGHDSASLFRYITKLTCKFLQTGELYLETDRWSQLTGQLNQPGTQRSKYHQIE